MKICTKCGRALPAKAFGKDKSKKDGLYPQCKECRNADCKERYASSPEMREQRRNWYQTYGKEHREERNAKNLARYHENMKDPAFAAARRKRNSDHAKTPKRKRSMRAWVEANPERVRRNRSRLNQQRRAAGPFPTEAWDRKLASIGNVCVYCGSDLHMEIDHIKPVSKGGTNAIENLQPLCRKCNGTKADKYPYDPRQTCRRNPLSVTHPEQSAVLI